MIRSFTLPAACIWLCATGCNTQPATAPSLTAVPLAAAAHCAHPDASGKALWLDNAAALREAYAALGGQRLGAPPAARPEFDFARYGAVAVFVGQKPAAGHGLSLGDPAVFVKNKTAELRLNFETPAAGSLTAQVVTSPCILVRLPRAGYTALRIVDQHGKTRHQLTINSEQ